MRRHGWDAQGAAPMASRPDAFHCVGRNRAHKLSPREFSTALVKRSREAVGVVDLPDDECYCISCDDPINEEAMSFQECRLLAACKVCGVVYCQSCCDPIEEAKEGNRDTQRTTFPCSFVARGRP